MSPHDKARIVWSDYVPVLLFLLLVEVGTVAAVVIGGVEPSLGRRRRRRGGQWRSPCAGGGTAVDNDVVECFGGLLRSNNNAAKGVSFHTTKRPRVL